MTTLSPAVDEWEWGQFYPDIDLMPPRLLGGSCELCGAVLWGREDGGPSDEDLCGACVTRGTVVAEAA